MRVEGLCIEIWDAFMACSCMIGLLEISAC